MQFALAGAMLALVGASVAIGLTVAKGISSDLDLLDWAVLGTMCSVVGLVAVFAGRWWQRGSGGRDKES